MATTAIWIGGSGDWFDPSNWDIDAVPNNTRLESFDVVIDDPASDLSISLGDTSTPVAVDSLTNSETLNIRGHSLTVVNELTNDSRIQISSQTSDAKLIFQGSTLLNDGFIQVDSTFGEGLRFDSDAQLTGNGLLELAAQSVVGGARQITIGASQTVSVSGDAGMEIDVSNRGSIVVEQTGSLYFDADVTNEVGGIIHANSGDITFLQTVDVNSLINHGTIEASVATVDINFQRFYPSTGLVTANQLGTVIVRPESSGNILANGTSSSRAAWRGDLVGGRWRAERKSSIRFLHNADSLRTVTIENLSADVELVGAASNIIGGAEIGFGGNHDALGQLQSIKGSGRFAVSGGREYRANGSISAFGEVHVGENSTLSVPSGSYTQRANDLIVDGTLDATTSIHPSANLSGTGQINGNVSNSGQVSPGSSPGTLTIDGNYTQFSNATLVIEIAGRAPGQFDQLNVSGTATLFGTLDIDLLDGFSPVVGDDFSILTSAGLNGQFATLDFPLIGGVATQQFIPTYTANGLSVESSTVPLVDFVSATTTDGVNGIMMPEHTLADDEGNVFVVGFFQGEVDFDRQNTVAGDTLNSSTNGDGFVARYTSDTNTGLILDWVNPIVGAHAYGVELTSNAAFVTGSFSGSVSYPGSGTVTGTGDVSTFILSMETTGTLGSLRSVSSTDNVIGRRLVYDPAGTAIYLVGEFDGILTDPFAGTLVSSGSTDAVIMKLEGSSIVGWSAYGDTGPDRATDIAIGTDGNLYMTGEQTVDYPFGGPSTDIFLRRLQPQVQFQAPLLLDELFYGSELDDGGTAVDVDDDGNILVGGYFSDSVDFANIGGRAFTLHSSGQRDGFLLKLDYSSNPNGHAFQWARQLGGHREDQVFDIAIDESGNIVSTGVFTDRVDFDPLNGIVVLETEDETSQAAFVSQLNADGEFDWATQFGPAASGAFEVQSFGFNFLDPISTGVSIDVDPLGNVITVGQFFDDVQFDPTGGQPPVSPSNNNGAGYIALLGQTLPPVAEIVGNPFVGSTGLSVPQGTVLPLVASVADPDSTQFEYAWSVNFGANPFGAATEEIATGESGSLPLVLRRSGAYRVDLTVTDESGNRSTDSTTLNIPGFSQDSGLQPTTYGSGLEIHNPIPEFDARYGEAVAAVPGIVRAGAPGTFSNQGLADGVIATPNPGAGDLFGSSIAMFSGHTAAGAPGHDVSGIVRITTPAATTVEVAPISNTADQFGASIAFAGGRLIVGSPGRTTPAGVDDGWVYIYRLTDASNFELERVIENPSPAANDEFGIAVSSVGDQRIIVGAPGDDTAGLNTGAAYVFDLISGEMLAEFFNPDPDAPNDLFGATVASDGNVALVGAPSDDTVQVDAGGVYLFDVATDSANFGQHIETLRNANSGGGSFGSALAADAGRAIVGAETDGSVVVNSGAAFVFNIDQASSGFGQQLATFKGQAFGSLPASGDRFGAAVAFRDQDIVIGAPGRESVAGVFNSGAYFVFAATSFTEVSTASPDEGETVTMMASVFDPGVADANNVTVNWGDGTETISLDRGVHDFEISHLYVDDSPGPSSSIVYGVTVEVEDESGSFLSTLAGNVTVNNVDPVVEIRSLPSDNPGEFVLEAVVTDDGVLDTFEFDWTGAVGTTGPTDEQQFRFTPAAGALNQNINVLVSDDDGGTGSETIRIRIGTNASEVITLANSNIRYIVFGLDGDDEIDASAVTSTRVELVGGIGDDTLIGGALDDLLIGHDGSDYENPASTVAYDDQLVGGLGNDTLDGGLGTNSLEGGAGNDTYIAFPSEIDTFTETGSGVDVVDFRQSTEGITFNLNLRNVAQIINPNALAADQGNIKLIGDFENIFGTVAIDDLTGNELANTIDGLDGNDVIRGGDPLALIPNDGDDTLRGGLGNDTIDGGSGDDEIVGDDGMTEGNGLPDDDSINGGIGNDSINGGMGDDVIYGGDAADSESGSPFSNDTLEGGLGNDSIFGGWGNDVIFGGDADDPDGPCLGGNGDTLLGGIGNDSLLGGACNDVIYGGDPADSEAGAQYNNDTLEGGLGNDSLLGGSGDDVIFGGDPGEDDPFCQEDNDTLQGGLGNDSLLGGACNDVIYGGDPGDSEAGFPDSHDTLEGGLGNDSLLGGSGNDVIFGGDSAGNNDPGNDSLIGGLGNDSLLGGYGNDVIFGGEFVGNPPVDVEQMAPGDDTLVGGPGDDTLVGGPGDDSLHGVDGQDVLRGGLGLDVIEGGVGVDLISEFVEGNAFFGHQPMTLLPDVTINGTTELLLSIEAAALFGGSAGDTLDASQFDGPALIRGGAGNDILKGGVFHDIPVW